MHFTQNPIGSADQLDLQDNAISFDYAMNSPAALWQDRFGKQHKTVQQALKDVGFKPAGFDFVGGGTLGIGDRDKCVFYPTDGYWYSWNGKLPYVVPANSSPTPGGKKGWGVVTRDERVIAREALRRTYLEAGYNIVEGSFEEGGVLVNVNDVLLQERTGKVFSGPAGAVAAGTNPVGDINWKPVTDNLLREELADTDGVSLVGGAVSEKEFNASSVESLHVSSTTPSDGMKVVVSRHYGSKFGGGKYVYDSSAPKSLHDGGRYISPTVPTISSQGGGISGTIAFNAKTGETDPGGFGVWSLIHDGWVSVEQYGAINSNLDQSDIVDKALSSGLNVRHEERGAVIGYRPGKLYSRLGQIVQGLGKQGGTKYRLVDGLLGGVTLVNGYAFEKESRSKILDIEIDGNEGTYRSYVNTVTPFESTPECGGVYTSRYYTNGSAYLRGDESFDDQLYIHDTIRSSYVFSGNSNKAGFIEVRNSLADHYLYFSNARKCRIDEVHCRGTFREEGVVFGTGSTAPSIDCSVGRLIIDAPVSSSYPVSNTYMRYVSARGSLDPAVIQRNVIDELIISHPVSNGDSKEVNRQIYWDSRTNLVIGKFTITTFAQNNLMLFNGSNGGLQFTDGEVNFVAGDPSGAPATSMDILHCRSTAGGYGGEVSYEKFKVRSSVGLSSETRVHTNNSSRFDVGVYVNDIAAVTAFRLLTTNGDSITTIRQVIEKSAIGAVIVPTYENGKPIVKVVPNGKQKSNATNTPEIGFDAAIALSGTASQVVDSFIRSADGQEVTLIGNGVASIASNSNIKLQGGASKVIPSGSAIKLTKVNGIFYEV